MTDPFDPLPDPGREAPFDPRDVDELPHFDAEASNDLANLWRGAAHDMTALRAVLGTLSPEEESTLRRVLGRVEEARVSRGLLRVRPWGPHR